MVGDRIALTDLDNWQAKSDAANAPRAVCPGGGKSCSCNDFPRAIHAFNQIALTAVPAMVGELRRLRTLIKEFEKAGDHASARIRYARALGQLP